MRMDEVANGSQEVFVWGRRESRPGLADLAVEQGVAIHKTACDPVRRH